jgi:putative membrane protein
VGLVFSHTPWYAGFYGDRPLAHGLRPLTDQQYAGGIMMTLDVLVMVFALTLFFWRSAADADRATRSGGALLDG